MREAPLRPALTSRFHALARRSAVASGAVAALVLLGAGFWTHVARPATSSSVCLDERTQETCTSARCDQRTCAEGELCQAGSCAPAGTAATTADFELTQDPDDPLSISCRVLAGGFPRDAVEHVRFQFGDDRAAVGERVTHTYAKPGVYPVELEVLLRGYRVLRASRLVVVGDVGPDHDPLELTVDRIPSYLNGSVPYRTNNGTPADPRDDRDVPFTLLLPSHGFTVDIALLETPRDEVDRNSIVLTTSRDLGDGRLRAGTNLAGRLRFDDSPRQRVPRASWLVAPDEAFPEGEVVLTLSARTTGGATLSRELRIETTDLGPDRRPFSRPMQWLLRFGMDAFTTTGSTLADGRVRISSRPGADGVPDFPAELALLGGQSADPAPGARDVLGRGARGASAIYLSWLEHAIVGEVYRYFRMDPQGRPHDGIQFQVLVEGDPGAPDPARFRRDGEFAMLRLGGELDGFLGRSYFGVYNHERVDDTGPGVGIATGTILDSIGSNATLSRALDPIEPGVGTPVGESPLDAVVLADGFDRHAADNPPGANERYDALVAVTRLLSVTIANIVAHEMGHGMGLVPNGAPPDGFFGGRTDVSFMGRHTDSHHADYPALNLMQSGASLVNTLQTTLGEVQLPRGSDLAARALDWAYENRLSPYELAYLQGRLTYRNFNGSMAAGWASCR